MRLLLVLLLALCPAGLLSADEKEAEQHHQHHKSHQPTSTRSFSDVERWKRIFDDPVRAAWQKPTKIPAELGLQKGMTVADIGAGTGYFQRFFAEAVGPDGKVYSIDVEQTLVDHLRERAAEEKTPNVIPVLADRDDPMLPDGTVDVVFICDTWHHLGNRVEYLGVVARGLTPEGILAVVDFRKKPLPVGPGTNHKIAKEEVVTEFEEAGWKLTRDSDLLPYQYFLIFSPP